MKENNNFDFEKHYGDEQETPPAFFWDDLEKQIPKKRKKRVLIFWVTGITAIAASILLATWGINYLNTTTNKEAVTTTAAEKQVEDKTNNTPSIQKENTAESNINPATSVDADKSIIAENTPTNAANAGQKESNSVPTNQKQKTPLKDDVHLFTHDKEKQSLDEYKMGEPHQKHSQIITPKHKHDTIELPIAEIQGEKWVTAEPETVNDTSKNKAGEDKGINTKSKYLPSLYIAFSGFAHTHTFSNFSRGISVGLGAIKKFNKNWETRIGINYTKVETPGLERSSTREHYFVTKTTTTQQLDITELHYLTVSAKLYYHYKKLQFYGGLEGMALVSSRANLKTTEIKYSEERVTSQNDIIGYTQGVSILVPQFIFGVGSDITKKLRAELQFSHSLTSYGSQSIFTDNKKLKLSYVGIGVNWRLN